MAGQFQRIVIVNRGEAAVRFIHAAREWSAEAGRPLEVVALTTDVEPNALFARGADTVIPIGGRVPRPAGAPEPASPYLDYAELERALRLARADAAWVGWGFVAEHPGFVDLCTQLGVVFIGPPAEAMRRLGDKITAKLLAEEAGVPVAAWSGGPVETLEDARVHATEIGYPLMIKAAAGGGGRGIRLVRADDELPDAFERSRSEALAYFGDDTVFLERVVGQARHIEVQVAVDDHDTAWALGVRDCSVQRRNQKVIEESASVALTPAQEEELRTAAANLVSRAGYRNVGTVEFLYEASSETFAFLEVNPRLQVEHTVTEVTTGIDLVKLQLHIAGGGRLEDVPRPDVGGHAIEARLNAEDPERGFAPAPGRLELVRFPSGPGIRVDTGVEQGDVIPAAFDSMIAKIIAWGRDRSEARARLRRALADTTVVVRGGTTNRAFLLDILDRPELRSGEVDTGWLDRLTTEPSPLAAPGSATALVAAAIEAYEADRALDRIAFYAAALRGRPRVRDDYASTLDVRHRGHSYHLGVSRVGPATYRVGVDGMTVNVHVERLGEFERRLRWGDHTDRAVVVVDGADHLIDVEGVAHRISRGDGGTVRAPSPALVIAVNVAPGDLVQNGQALVVLEAMKMETAVTAPFAGRVREVRVGTNIQVDAGAPLLLLEPTTETASAVDTARVDFVLGEMAVPEPAASVVCREHLETFRNSILGFDVDPTATGGLVESYEQLRRGVTDPEADLLRDELAVLQIFADLCELSRNQRDDPASTDIATRSAREHLTTYVQSLDIEGEGIPETFREKLRRAVGHYGLSGLDHTPELEDTLYWIFQAQQRAGDQVPIITTILEAYAELHELTLAAVGEELRSVLDHLVAATQVRYPAVGDIARLVRFRTFDERLIHHERDRVDAEMRGHVDYLGAHPDAEDREERIELLVACPQPLISLLPGQNGAAGSRGDPMLEVLTRRFYKIRDLAQVDSSWVEGRPFVTAEYELRGREVHLVATRCTVAELSQAVSAVAMLSSEHPEGTTVVDIYAERGDGAAQESAPDLDGLAGELLRTIEAADLPRSIRRVSVSLVAAPTGAARPGDTVLASAETDPVHYFTFRRAEAQGAPAPSFREDSVVRGIHPMIAVRLQLWRLSNFDLERFESSEDTYLFHCRGRDDPKDVRLVALAEVRDLTPVRDASGQVIALPELERVLDGCLDGLNRARSRLGPRPPEWNRIVLYVWPPVEVPIEELLPVVTLLAPRTDGLGLEEVIVQARVVQQPGGELHDVVLRVANPTGSGLTFRVTDPPEEPLRPLDGYTRKVLQSRRRGAMYPYELVRLLTRSHSRAPGSGGGEFVEHDLDGEGRLVPVDRAAGANTAALVVGVVRTPMDLYPEGVTRVVLLSDPTKVLGSIAEAECRLIVAAIDLAESLGVPVEWFTISAGATISMEAGTETLDWVARALRRLVEFTQAGGEVNVVLTGINVGGQSYWNAEATMLMHCRGILIMTPQSAMVLTGKQALEFSGGVSAEDNGGIGGFELIMGPNGEAQFWAENIARAWDMLLAHYENTYVAAGERFPRRAPTTDPVERNVGDAPHAGEGTDFQRVGDIFSESTNPGRKKPFDIRSVLRSVLDVDHAPMERWAAMADAENAVVLDARMGGYAVCLVGIESRALPRFGFVPADGPDQWTAGTLFPLSAKKVARAINVASGSRPVVILANLSGFDGSPESMRKLQLEYGAEIGRAIVNFDGPIVFCVISRYHGGAFVVFSGALNDGMEVSALEGSYASVIGGAPAAAVAFTSEVDARTRADARVRELAARVAEADGVEFVQRRAELSDLSAAVRSEKLGEVAAEFDAIHSIERAREVGSVHRIVGLADLRPYLVDAVERGMQRTAGSTPGTRSAS